MKNTILTILLSTIFCAAAFAGGLRQNRSINEIYNDLINGREITHAESTNCAAAYINSLNAINFFNVNLVTESNIDDFPYDTEIIAKGYRANQLLSSMELNEEEEVQDFPYNTEVIANGFNAGKMLCNMKLTNENEVQDFPYDTEVIARGMLSMHAFAGMKLAEEQNVDDVPFDTAMIVSKLMNTAE
jgi:hypothetical protein